MAFKTPRFKNFYHVEIIDEPPTVFLVAEHKHRVFTGRTSQLVASLLTGEYTVGEIVKLLDGKVPQMEVYFLINYLERAGLLAEGNGSLSVEASAFWELTGSTSQAVTAALPELGVSIQVVGNVDAGPLENALQSFGISIVESGAKLNVVVTDDYLHEIFEEINSKALANNQPWLPVKMVGNVTWIGPFFALPETACWKCLEQRLRGNRQVESYIQRKKEQSEPMQTSRSAVPSIVNAAAGMAALEIAKWLIHGQSPLLTNQLRTYDASLGELTQHRLVRRPQCPVCGDPEFLATYLEPQPIVLKEGKKRHISDGGHRTLLPDETLKKTEHNISPITGVISRIRNIAQENDLIYSYIASHNFAMMTDDIGVLRKNLTSRSGGKGMTDTQAKVSAISEAIERYSGVYRGDDEFMIRSSYKALEETAVHFHDLLLYSENQYDNPPTWVSHDHAYRHMVPYRFDEEKEIDWTPIWSLNEKRFKHIPTSYCYYGHPDLRLFFSDVNSNGCAAGNTLEEAILQGFLEVVERDAVAVWWYNYVQRPAVDIHSFNLPYFDTLEALYKKHNRTFWVLDITNDLKIPAFVAVSALTEGEEDAIIVGFGCHLDPKIGLLRALTEMNQRLPDVIQLDAEGKPSYRFGDKEKIEWLREATLEKETYLAPHPGLKMMAASDYARLHSDNIRDDIAFCVAAAEAVGLETLVLDQTRADVNMSVCKVVIPGLRHYLRRLGSGRLYDVPVKLGWVEQAIAEDEMNPYSVSVCF